METVSIIEIGYERPKCKCGTLMEIKKSSITEVDDNLEKGVLHLELVCDNARCPKGVVQNREFRFYDPSILDVYNPETHRPHKIPSSHR